ncbi:type II toxin-antitoxin system VapC family toxin [Pseudonocardia alaniniphila]|uniref:Ribonuclease VapC n=1 Tax=Pseudonocardia alaniniphila TaxID=75291 RepID=A0ABS9TLR0_9PSEU|nr:type II toxin-antitoxin system VapC family toxin [Pseudonocardia alaniniphila]MCH6169470.1 type II toxin-antitoxin system VapC family toxin [Pseudonocardia alaniniphila]
MIGYLDTSAFVPLLVAEPGSPACRRFWDDADAVVSCRLLYVETAAALAQALRMARLDKDQYERARHLLDALWAEVEVIEFDELLALAAAEAAHALGLRGYDAVHCAAAEQLADEDLVAASGDRRLLEAWSERGLSTYDTNA